MQAGVARAIASFCRSGNPEKPVLALGRARHRTFADSSIALPSAADCQGAPEVDALNAVLSGVGISPSKLPRTFSQSHRACSHHVAELLAFFTSMGISGDGFCRIVSLYPRALMLDPGTEINVSVTLLESALGKSLVSECILSWPTLLGLGSPRNEIGLGLEPADQKSEQESGAGARLASSEASVGSRCGFSETGVSLKSREKLLGSCEQEPRSPQQDFAIRIDFLLKCGFKKNTKSLGKAIYCTLNKRNQDVDALFNTLMSLGFSWKNAGRLIRLQPTIFQQKPSEIASKLDFLLRSLSLSLDYLFKHSSLMLYSLDSHIRPRCLMHKWVKSKRLLRRNFKLDYIMSMPEKQFLCKFVECHEGGLSIYHGFMRNARR